MNDIDGRRSKEQEARSKRGKVEKRAAVGDAPPRSRPEEKEKCGLETSINMY